MKSCAVVTEEQHQTDRHEHQSPVQSKSPELQACWAASRLGWTTSPRTTVNGCCMAGKPLAVPAPVTVTVRRGEAGGGGRRLGVRRLKGVKTSKGKKIMPLGRRSRGKGPAGQTVHSAALCWRLV